MRVNCEASSGDVEATSKVMRRSRPLVAVPGMSTRRAYMLLLFTMAFSASSSGSMDTTPVARSTLKVVVGIAVAVTVLGVSVVVIEEVEASRVEVTVDGSAVTVVMLVAVGEAQLKGSVTVSHSPP